MMEVMEDMKCGGLILSCCLRNPQGKASKEAIEKDIIDQKMYQAIKLITLVLLFFFQESRSLLGLLLRNLKNSFCSQKINEINTMCFRNV